MNYTAALQAAITLYGENWYRQCSVRLTHGVYAVFATPPSRAAFRRV